MKKKEMRIKELKATIEVLRNECYVFNPLNIDRTIMINKALDVAIRELERLIKEESEVETELGKAIMDLIFEYDKEKEADHIRKPVSYALYQTWKKWDGREKEG